MDARPDPTADRNRSSVWKLSRICSRSSLDSVSALSWLPTVGYTGIRASTYR